MYEMMSDAEINGILDRLKFWEAIKVYENVTVGDLMSLLRAVQSKDLEAIRLAIGAVASKAGFELEAQEIDDIAQKALEKNVKGIVYETCDAIMKFIVKYGGYVPEAADRQFQITGEDEILDTRTMTRQQSQEWFARKREQIRDAAKMKWALFLPVRRIIEKRSPELYKLLAGEMTAEAYALLTPEQQKRLVDAMRMVSKALTYGSILAGPYAPLVIMVAQAINLLIARYDSLHPTGDDTADLDRGLDFTDLLI